MYQIDDDEKIEMWEQIKEENQLTNNENHEDYIVLWNWKTISKNEIATNGYIFVDENLELLTLENIKEFYNMLTDEEKTDCYPTLNHFINEGLSINGTLERIRL